MILLPTTVLPTNTMARLHSNWPLTDSDMKRDLEELNQPAFRGRSAGLY